jgi:hypothetical protein
LAGIHSGQGIAMPRFYFDVREGTRFVPDDEGLKFDSPDAAVHAATRSTTEIGTGRLAKGDTRDVVIEVRAEQSGQVCTVTTSMRIEWHDPSPQAPHSWSV